MGPWVMAPQVRYDWTLLAHTHNRSHLRNDAVRPGAQTGPGRGVVLPSEHQQNGRPNRRSTYCAEVTGLWALPRSHDVASGVTPPEGG